MTRISSRSIEIWLSNSSRWLCMLMYSPAAIEKAPASRPATPASTIRWLSAVAPAMPITSDRLLTRPSLAPKTAARSVPDRPPRCHASSRRSRRAGVLSSSPRREPGPDRGVLALVGRDRRRLGRQLRRRRPAPRRPRGRGPCRPPRGAETPSDEDDHPHARARTVERRHLGARLLEARRPDLGVAALVGGDALERGGAVRILLDLGQLVVQDDRVALELEVRQASRALVRGQRTSRIAESGHWLEGSDAPAIVHGRRHMTHVPDGPTLLTRWTPRPALPLLGRAERCLPVGRGARRPRVARAGRTGQ